MAPRINNPVSLVKNLGSTKTIILAFGLFFIFSFLHAETKTWNQTSGGVWDTGTNWTPAGVPATGDDVIIPADPNIRINKKYSCYLLK